jgi:hypothetical protein
LELPIHSLADKHVTREQREPELLGTVLPLADGTIQGKIDLVIFIRKRERDGFFVLMARKNSVPVGCPGRASNFHFGHMHIALPSELQETLALNSVESCPA